MDNEATAAGIPETKLRLEQGPARDILSSITLVWACTQALPRILTGNLLNPVTTVGHTKCSLHKCL